MTGLDLSFSCSEDYAGMRRLLLSERARGFIRERIRAYGRGAQAHMARYLNQSPAAHRKLTPPEISMMFQTGKRAIDLDTLEDVAAFFKEPVSKVLGIPDESNLSSEEQRMIHALRAITPGASNHLISIAEHLSIQARAHYEPTVASPALAAIEVDSLIGQLAALTNQLVRLTHTGRQAADPRASVPRTPRRPRSARQSHPSRPAEK